jgi:hypothetical protein
VCAGGREILSMAKQARVFNIFMKKMKKGSEKRKRNARVRRKQLTHRARERRIIGYGLANKYRASEHINVKCM